MKKIISYIDPTSLDFLDTNFTPSADFERKIFKYNNLCEIENNVWGIPTGAVSKNNYQQRIFDDGWQWQITAPCTLVAGYPEINIGKKPWVDSNLEKKEASDWPKKYEDLATFSCDIDFACQANGSYNTAFEFWLLKDKNSCKKNITSEVMIWLQNSGKMPYGAKIAENINFNGEVFDLFVGQTGHDPRVPGGWNLISFLRKGENPVNTIKINVKEFLDYLYEKNILDPEKDKYIANFEFGNELFESQGITKISKFEVETSLINTF
ncbi:MAG: hypothetical protein WC860_00605 [Candidatus Margulisiibacteriota bacterium]|jgi:hypothetical protein